MLSLLVRHRAGGRIVRRPPLPRARHPPLPPHPGPPPLLPPPLPQDSGRRNVGLLGRRTGLVISTASLKVDADGFDDIQSFWDSEKGSSSVDDTASPPVGECARDNEAHAGRSCPPASAPGLAPHPPAPPSHLHHANPTRPVLRLARVLRRVPLCGLVGGLGGGRAGAREPWGGADSDSQVTSLADPRSSPPSRRRRRAHRHRRAHPHYRHHSRAHAQARLLWARDGGQAG